MYIKKKKRCIEEKDKKKKKRKGQDTIRMQEMTKPTEDLKHIHIYTIFSRTGFVEEKTKASGGTMIKVSKGTAQRLGTSQGF